MLRVAAGARVDRHVELGPFRGEAGEERADVARPRARRLPHIHPVARTPDLGVAEVARVAALRTFHDGPARRRQALAARRALRARRVGVDAHLRVRVVRDRVFRHPVRRPVRQYSKRRQRRALIVRDAKDVPQERREPLRLAVRERRQFLAGLGVRRRAAVAHPVDVQLAAVGRPVLDVLVHALVAGIWRPVHRRERVFDGARRPLALRVPDDAADRVVVRVLARLLRGAARGVSRARAARERAGRPHVVDVTIAFAVPRPLPAAVVRVDARRAVAGRRARRDDERRAERAREHRGLFERAF
mmetsp:Transcript_16916/g.52707  ORF Transcript_16916/g.52707 Transcript_16916/m.52707 type:complete len:302 (-) Transcript_16916:186-1091(-)